MAYVSAIPSLGNPKITASDTTAAVALGTIIRAVDPTYGAGEFIYLLGAANTVVGSLVRYNATTFQTTLVANTAVQVAPVAVAMSANLATYYGWYQIEGLAVIKKTAVQFNPTVPMFLSSTSGRVKAVASNGLQVVGARTANLTTVTTTTSTITALINRPHLQSQIT